jgi:hypothetical protein
MEIMKKELADFAFQDIVFHVRTRATVGDKLALEKLSAEAINDIHNGALPKMGREVVRIFVDGWTGVTVDGKPAPYSYELLESGLPADIADELMPALCRFVAANVDILKPS